MVCASVRAVEALAEVLCGPWPASLRSAAVGAATGRALEALGVPEPPLVATGAGAEALWEALATLDTWPTRRVLVLTTPGGRTTLPAGLVAAGAAVDAVEAYRMEPLSPAEIRRVWATSAADALAVGSPRAVTTLIEAVGADAVLRLRAIVAIGETTAGALRSYNIDAQVPPSASFESVAEMLARLQSSGTEPAAGRDASSRRRS